MIVVLNAIRDTKIRRAFDQTVVPFVAARTSAQVTVQHLCADEALRLPAEGTHLLVSGSELSASRAHAKDEEVYDFLREALERTWRIFAICWGHQMLAKALAGPEACRRAAMPEFGWRRVEVDGDELFGGLSSPIFAHSHFDEVVDDLPEGLDVIARTPDCAVQGVRVHGRPVWGVQFHPEVGYAAGQAMFERNLAEDPSLRAVFHEELSDPSELEGNVSLFDVFLGPARRA